MSFNAAIKQKVSDYIFRVNIAPCKGCEDRVPACHDHCQNYKDWKDAVNAKKDAFEQKYRTDYSGIKLTGYELKELRRGNG